MADGKITIETEVDSRGVDKGLNDTRSKVANIANELRRQGADSSSSWKQAWQQVSEGGIGAAGNLSAVFEGVYNKVKSAALGVGEGILKIGVASAQTGMQFESSMAQVAATMGMTADEINNGSENFEKLSNAAKEMGANTQFSASQSADALNYLALAGYDADKAIETLPTVLNLATAGNMDLAQASDMVTDSMSALGISTDQAESFTDKLAKTAQKSNTSVAQLGEGLLTVGGTAKNLAGGVTEANTCLGILADNGIKGAEGGTALRNVILSLSAPTNQAAAKMKELGLNAFDSNGNLRPLNETFQDLNGILGNMTAEKRTEVLNTLFNKVDLKSVNALLANSGQRFDELSEAIANSDGACQDMAETMQNTLEYKLTSLKSGLEGVGISIYEKMEEPLKNAAGAGVDALTKINDSLNNGALGDSVTKLGESFAKLVEVLANGLVQHLPAIINFLTFCLDHAEAIAVGIGLIGGAFKAWKIITDIQKAVKFIKEMEIATKAMAVAQGILNAVMAINPIVLVVMAVIALIGALVLLYNKSETFRNFINGLWDSIKNFCVWLGSVLGAFFTETIPSWWDSVKQSCADMWNSVCQFFANGVDAIVNFFVGVKDSIVSFFTETIPSAIQSVITWFEMLPERIGYIIGYLIGCFINGCMTIWDFVTVTIPQIIENICIWFSELPGRVWNFLVETYNNVKQWGIDTWNAAIEAGTNFITAIVEYFTQLPGRVWDFLVSCYNNIKQWATDTWNAAKQAGSNFINSVVQFFSQLPGKVWNFLSQCISRVAEWARNLANKATEAARNMVNNVTNGIKSLPSKIKSIGGDIVRGLWNGISGAAGWLYNKVAGFARGILSGMKRALGIHSPSKLFRDQVGKFIAQGVGVGFTEENKNTVKDMDKSMKGTLDRLKTTVSNNIQMPNFDVSKSYNMAQNVNVAGILDNVKNVIDNNITLEVEGREIAYAVAPYQNIISDYSKGR